MASNRRKHFQQARKKRKQDRKKSLNGILSCSFGVTALILFVISVALSWAASGSAGYSIGGAGLFGLILALGALGLAVLSRKEADIDPVPGRFGLVSGLILTIILGSCYAYGFLA